MGTLSFNIYDIDNENPKTPRKRRFQVQHACTLCKKAHAACSLTRPCTRCIHLGVPNNCVDAPSKNKDKELTNQPSDPVDSPPSFEPIDNISDFLFEGLESNLLDHTFNTINANLITPPSGSIPLSTESSISPSPTFHANFSSTAQPELFSSPTQNYTNTHTPANTHIPTQVPQTSSCSSCGQCYMVGCCCTKKVNSGKAHIVCANHNIQGDSHSPSQGCSMTSSESTMKSIVESLASEVQELKKEIRRGLVSTRNVNVGEAHHSRGPAIAVWDLVDLSLLECNTTFTSMFGVDTSQPLYLSDIGQCPAHFLKLLAGTNSWHEKRRYSLRRPVPEGDVNLVISIDINGDSVVTTVWKEK